MIASNNNRSNSEGKHDTVAVTMAPPAKKAKMYCHIVPQKVQTIVKSNEDNYGVYNDDNETLFTKAAMLLNNGDPLAIE